MTHHPRYLPPISEGELQHLERVLAGEFAAPVGVWLDLLLGRCGDRGQRADLPRMALASPHLPPAALEQALRHGTPLAAWGHSSAPLLLWGKPAWAPPAAALTLLRAAGRLGWPEVPEEALGELATGQGVLADQLGQLARRRCAIEVDRVPPPAPPGTDEWYYRMTWREHQEGRHTERLPMICWIDRTEQMERDTWGQPRRSPGRVVWIWDDHHSRPVRAPPCDEAERRALDLIAATLGAPA